MAAITNMSRDPPAGRGAGAHCRRAVEACPNALVLTDVSGRIVIANPAAERLFDYPPNALLGQMIEILVPERLHDLHLQRRIGFARHPEPRLGQRTGLCGRRRDGTEFPAEITLAPISTRDGVMVLSVIADVSEGVRLDRLKDEFVSTVSHELRTPLTSIAGSLGLLSGGAAGALPDAALRLIGIAQNNCQRLLRLINDILDIEKIESGQVAFKFGRFSARSLVEQVVEANRAYADSFDVSVRLEGAASTADVYADADRLGQVVTNLLSNAIKFSPACGEVTLAIADHGEFVRITVRDRGPGIPPEFRARIFEKFAQADGNDSRPKGGTGLGLSIVKQIVTRLGGSVGFAEAAGGGTVFHVDIPAWARIASRERDREGSPQTRRILLCEDDADAALALRDALRPFGFAIDFLHDAADLPTRVEATRHAAILVDIDWSDHSGLDLIRTLRRLPKLEETPIIALGLDLRRREARASSGHSEDEIFAFIDKPVDIHRTAEILNRALVDRQGERPLILHVDDDGDVLELVAAALERTASVVSAASIEQAHSALAAHAFDLVILDLGLGATSGLDLIPDLNSAAGMPIPVIVFSAHAAELADGTPVALRLRKSSSAALQDLTAAVRERLLLPSGESQSGVA